MNFWGQIARFATIGALATVVHVVVAMLCSTFLAFPPQSANLAGFATAVSLSYFGQGRLTFKTDLQHRVHAPRFVVTSLAGLVISSGITEVIAVQMAAPFALAMAIVALAVPFATYTLCRFWVFKPEYSSETSN